MKNLVIISKHLGDDLSLVQGAGGNTSVKEDGVLWVKASGCRLKDAKSRNIFVPVDHSKLVKDLTECGDCAVLPATLRGEEGAKLRPSIETSLHALMPHRYVIHVHSVNAIAYGVLQNGNKKVCELLKGINWAWIPYVRPGIPLTRSVQQVSYSKPDVLMLANHGLVFGGESKVKVFELLDELESRLYRPRRESIAVSDVETASVLKAADYVPTKYSLAHSLAFDSVSLSVMAKGPLYPDHVVFLGMGPMLILARENLEDYLKAEQGLMHKVIIVKDVGVFKHQSLGENAEEMLHCLADVLLRLQPGEKLRFLTHEEEAEIAGWDAEKFRQTNQNL